jgi:hypothetical protein
MKKTIRLTEKDLTRIVKRIISEEGEDTQYDMSLGHDNQEMEDAAVKIIEMMHNMINEQDDIVRLLYTSGLMSYPEAKRIKDSFDQINSKLVSVAMKFPND